MCQVKQALSTKQYSSNIQYELARLFHLLTHLAAQPQFTSFMLDEVDTAIATLLKLDPDKPSPEGVWQRWAYEEEQIAFARSIRRQIELQVQLSPYPLKAVFRASGPPHHRLISGLLWFLLLFAFIPASVATFAFVFPTTREVSNLRDRNEVLRDQLVQSNQQRERAQVSLGIVNLRLPELIDAVGSEGDNPGNNTGGTTQQAANPTTAEAIRAQQLQTLQGFTSQLTNLENQLLSVQTSLSSVLNAQPLAPDNGGAGDADGAPTASPSPTTTPSPIPTPSPTATPSPANNSEPSQDLRTFLTNLRTEITPQIEQTQQLLNSVQQVTQTLQTGQEPIDEQQFRTLRQQVEQHLSQIQPLTQLLQSPVQTIRNQTQRALTLEQQLNRQRQRLLNLQRELEVVAQANIELPATTPTPSPSPTPNPTPETNPASTDVDPTAPTTSERSGFLDALDQISDVISYPAVQFLLWIIAAGALGGFTSVIVRSKRLCDRTPQDQVDLFFVGFFRPVVGMSFALFLVAVLESGVFSSFLQIGAGANQLGRNIFLYIAISFAAGFSESLVPDVMSQTMNQRSSDDDD